ncbi:hypothetical protein HN858_02710 [Candidatus Falkowbacteria bacterium]|jgi:hypothetical protein|nr:hypothetical protein [Candidatus Falkowbacteria bacterium]MBT7348567.1 hypothetical protein [Candidatus Falkowbacteria bacterium]MBT7501049.1 hypothetical protein [Candidatus Falkowbacteria bacterium]
MKTTKIFSLLPLIILSLVLFTGCSHQTPADNQDEVVEIIKQEATNVNSPITPKMTLSKNAKYKVEFVAEWSAATHPNDYPAGAHFSPFVAYSHNSSTGANIFTKGETPTPGVEEMSESGKTAILIKEIQNIIDSNFALNQTKGKRIDSPGIDSNELNFSQDFSYITFVSMLAPSPDWFVAASTNLIENEKWKDKIELKLITYDSGGDDGQELTSKDKDSDPKQNITIFNDNLQKLGKIILTKI